MVFYQPRSNVYGTVDGPKYYDSPIPTCKLESLINTKFKYVLVIDNESGDEDDDAIDYNQNDDAVASKMPVHEQEQQNFNKTKNCLTFHF